MRNGAVQKKSHNKKLIPKYLGKLLDTTFRKYSSINMLEPVVLYLNKL